MASAIPKKYMHIDDDPDDRLSFYEALKDIDPSALYEYEENGLYALTTLRAAKSPLPDHIFLDFNMHRMDGKEFLALIKIEEKLKHIPIAILTTSTDESDKAYARKLGAVYFITKPTSHAEFMHVIRMVLQSDKEHEDSKWVTKF